MIQETLLTLIYFSFFLTLSLSCFYNIGFLVIDRLTSELKNYEKISLSFTLGIIFFVLGSTTLEVMGLRFLLLPFLISANLFILVKLKEKLFFPWKIFISDKILLTLILIGIFVQGSINFPSGFLYPQGLLFWSSQGHDGIWHVALMEEIKKSFPPQNPVFAGERLYNYHYLVDLLMGEFARIFPFFPTLDLYFRFFPILLSFLIGLSSFSLITRWLENKKIGYLGIFFTYLSGSFGYIVTFIKHRQIFGGETVFWAAQGNTIIGNPPHAISYSLIMSFFLSFFFYLQKRDKYWFLICLLLGGLLAGFKVQAGLVMLVGIVTSSIVDLVVNKKVTTLLLSVFLGLSNFITFKLMTHGAESLLLFLPWWFIRTMVVGGDRLDWVDLELRRQYYLSLGTWRGYLRVAQIEVMSFLIFLIGNLGTKIIGFYSLSINTYKGIKNKFFSQNIIEASLIAAMVTGLVVPLLFVQKGIIYNNIAFMQYFILIFGFYASITVYKLITFFKSRILRTIILIVIIIFSIPTVIGNFNEFYGPGRTPLAKVSNLELVALSYLKNHTKEDAVILSVPFNKNLKNNFPDQPRPIYAWYSTPYIAALASRRVYLEAEEQVLITGYPQEKRRNQAKRFFETDDSIWQRQFLKQNKIDYIYISKSETGNFLDKNKLSLRVFFENNDVIIYKVVL